MTPRKAFGKRHVEPPQQPPEEQMITVYDAYGRPMQVTREVWRTQVLPDQIKAHWQDPEGLYALIIQTVEDGLAEDVREAAQHLLSIDPVPERSHVTLGIVLMKTGRTDEARKLLTRYTEKHGETGTILTNYAKTFDDRTTHKEILKRALRLDPNLDNALLWWASIHDEEGGIALRIASLEEIAALPGSWRALLLLGQAMLEQGKKDEALSHFRKGLFMQHDDPGVLMQISGVLGQNGMIAELLQLIEPYYEPERHALPAGLNLLQAYLETGQTGKGMELLDALYALDMPPFREHLNHYAEAFEARRENRAVPVQEPVSVDIFTMDTPPWYYGLKDPTWLLEEIPAKSARKVAFMPLAISTDLTQAQAMQENIPGKISRTVALYLMEEVQLNTDIAAYAPIMAVRGGGPVVFGKEPTREELAGLMQRGLPEGTTHVLTGIVTEQPEAFEVGIRLWDTALWQVVHHDRIQIPRAAPSDALLALRRNLIGFMQREGFAAASAVPCPWRNTEESPHFVSRYPYTLNSALTLTFVYQGVTPKDSLWMERGIYDHIFEVAYDHPDLAIPTLQAFSAFMKGLAYQSDVVNEYRPRVAELLRRTQAPGDLCARLSPLLHKALGDPETAAKRIAELGPGATPAYREWLTRITE